MVFLGVAAVRHPRTLQEMIVLVRRPLIYLAIGAVTVFTLALYGATDALVERISADPDEFPTLYLQAQSGALRRHAVRDRRRL